MHVASDARAADEFWSHDPLASLRIALQSWRSGSVARGRNFTGAPLSAMVAGQCRLAGVLNSDHLAVRGPSLRSQAHQALQIAGPIFTVAIS